MAVNESPTNFYETTSQDELRDQCIYRSDVIPENISLCACLFSAEHVRMSE